MSFCTSISRRYLSISAAKSVWTLMFCLWISVVSSRDKFMLGWLWLKRASSVWELDWKTYLEDDFKGESGPKLKGLMGSGPFWRGAPLFE